MTPVGIEILNKTKYEFCMMIICEHLNKCIGIFVINLQTLWNS